MKLPSPKQREFYEQAATAYSKQLADDTAAQAYLMTRRISPADAATFRLGVVREPLVGHEDYRGRLSIPYVTPAGVVNFTFRCIVIECDRCGKESKEGGHPKYWATSLDRNLYNVLALETESQTIHVTEGELDALTLTIAGLPAVGVPGADNWQKHWAICLSDFAEVYVWGDADAAGYKFATKLEKLLRARRVALPRGKDVNRVYVDGGASALRALVAA